MTYKYIYIREALFEKDPENKFKSKSNRSFGEIKSLLKPISWVMLITILLSGLAYFVALFTCNEYSWIPLIIFAPISILFASLRNKFLFYDTASATELIEQANNYDKYVLEIAEIFRPYIKSYKELMKLKSECEATLKTYEKKYVRTNSKIYDLFIGVPLGALIASLIYTNNNVQFVAIGVVIFIGVFIMVFVKMIRFIERYISGYNKDHYLLDAINELDYSEETFVALCKEVQRTK